MIYRPEIFKTICDAIDGLDKELRDLSLDISGLSLLYNSSEEDSSYARQHILSSSSRNSTFTSSEHTISSHQDSQLCS